ncbi:hypothetical protein PG987_009672 [Apiospora arundinis]
MRNLVVLDLLAGKRPFPEGQEDHQELHRIIDEELDYRRDFDGGQLIANAEGGSLAGRIERGSLPQWLIQTLQTRLTPDVVARYDNEPSLQPLLDQVLDWASKWAAVRVRYTTSLIGSWPKNRLQSFQSRRFGPKADMMINLNRAIIHAADPEGDALLTTINKWASIPATNQTMMSTAYAQPGTESRLDANWRYYLVYKMSPREILWIAHVRDTTTELTIREFFTWILKYIKASVDFQEKLFDAIEMRSRGVTSDNLASYRGEARRQAGPARGGATGDDTGAAAPAGPVGGDSPAGDGAAHQPTVTNLLLNRTDMTKFRDAVRGHNRAARDFSVVDDLELNAAKHAALYDDVESMLRSFPGPELGPAGTPDIIPERLMTTEPRNLPYGFHPIADLNETGMTAATVEQVGFNWTGSLTEEEEEEVVVVVVVDLLQVPQDLPLEDPEEDLEEEGLEDRPAVGEAVGTTTGATTTLGGEEEQVVVALGGGMGAFSWRNTRNHLRSQTAEFSDARPWAGCPVDTVEDFLLLCDKFEADEHDDSTPSTPSKAVRGGVAKAQQKFRVMHGLLERPTTRLFSKHKNDIDASRPPTPSSKLGEQVMITTPPQKQQSYSPFSTPGDVQSDLSTPPSAGPSKPLTSSLTQQPPPKMLLPTAAPGPAATSDLMQLPSQQDKATTLTTTTAGADPFYDPPTPPTATETTGTAGPGTPTTATTPTTTPTKEDPLHRLERQLGALGKPSPDALETNLEQHQRLTQLQAMLQVMALELGEQARRCQARIDHDILWPNNDPWHVGPSGSGGPGGLIVSGVADADDDVVDDSPDRLFDGEIDIMDDNNSEGGDEEKEKKDTEDREMEGEEKEGEDEIHYEEEVMDEAGGEGEYNSEDDMVMTGVMEYDSDDEDEY